MYMGGEKKATTRLVTLMYSARRVTLTCYCPRDSPWKPTYILTELTSYDLVYDLQLQQHQSQ